MKKRLQGFIAGVLCCIILGGIGVLAKSSSEIIEVFYNDIKVYKDNVLCELKDGNGDVIEPFIYNGTTYMPVRGTANLAGMEVTWDGAAQSVYLWDESVPDGTYLMEVCPPYEVSNLCYEYYAADGESFLMAGEKYSNGLEMEYAPASALFNLDSKYSNLECVIGHTDYVEYDKSISFFVDGKLVEEVTLEAECLPKKVSIPVSYGLQLKILVNGSKSSKEGNVGIGNITVN